MNNPPPLISVVLPVFNGEKYLAESIESVIAQTYSHWELIIVDDCSTDSTPEIIKNYVKNNRKIRVVRNSINMKLPASLNIGFKVAKGEYHTWTSDDNRFKNNAFEIFLREISRSNSDIVYSNYQIIDSTGKILRNENVSDEKYIYAILSTCGPSFLYKKSVFHALNGYDEKKFLVEDFDFWIRASFKFKIKKINANLYLYREHKKSLTHLNGSLIINATYKLIEENVHYVTNEYKYLTYSKLIYLARVANDLRKARFLFFSAMKNNGLFVFHLTLGTIFYILTGYQRRSKRN